MRQYTKFQLRIINSKKSWKYIWHFIMPFKPLTFIFVEMIKQASTIGSENTFKITYTPVL